MTKKITAVSILMLSLGFCAYAPAYAAQPETQPAVKIEAAAAESGFKAWWNKWRGKSEEKAVQLIDNREAIAEKAKDKGVKIKSAAEKMAAQAEKQRSKGNDNAAAKLQSNAERLGGLGDTLKEAGEKVKDKGGAALKSVGKYMGKKK
jgi:hypothetical protein